MTTPEPTDHADAAGAEPLQPHPDVPDLLQCQLCGGVTQTGGVLAHHLPACPWRIQQQIAAGADPTVGAQDLDELGRRLSAARGEASFHADRNVYLERRLTRLEACRAQFKIDGDRLAYVPHSTAGHHPCAVQVTCDEARLALRVLLRNEVATRTGSESAAPAPYQPTVAPIAAGRAGAAPHHPPDRQLAADGDPGHPSGLHPRWPSHVARQVALGRIDPARWPAVEADLGLVDQLQGRLAEMTFPHPHGGEPMTAVLPLEQLLTAARHTIVRWHEGDQRSPRAPQ